MTLRKSAKEIFPVPSLSTSPIIFLISSFFGSKPRALIATWPSEQSMLCMLLFLSSWHMLFITSIWGLLPWAPWHRWIQIHQCQTARKPPLSPASAPQSAQVWGLSSCEEGALAPAGRASCHWSPVGSQERRENQHPSIGGIKSSFTEISGNHKH